MLKRLAVLLLSLCSLPALADTFIGLNNPSNPTTVAVHPPVCAGESFSTDGKTVTGVCQFKALYGAKYQQTAAWQYSTTWDAATGAAALGALSCYDPAHFGIDHSGCPTMVSLLDTNEVVVLEGVPFWYVTSDALGAELLHTQTGSLIFYP